LNQAIVGAVSAHDPFLVSFDVGQIVNFKTDAALGKLIDRLIDISHVFSIAESAPPNWWIEWFAPIVGHANGIRIIGDMICQNVLAIKVPFR
jgi:hypothetical protein